MGVYTRAADPYDDTGYSDCHGTSCANPLLGGAAALLMQAFPVWEPIELREILKATATQSTAPDTVLGWGVVQAADALEQVTYVIADMELGGFGRGTVPSVPPIALAASPNPFNPSVSLKLTLQTEMFIKVGIYDARGALIDTLIAEKVSAGERVVAWEGKDRLGRQVPSGVYFAYVQGPGIRVTEKLNLVR